MKRNLLVFSYILLGICFISQPIFAQWKSTNGPYSGRIHSVIVSNGELLAGSNCIYKSTDNGKTWNISNNGISVSVSYIRSLVKINSNLVAGTDAGAYYSTDNGNNWTICAGTSALGVYSMIVKGSNVFLSTYNSGLYKSVNNGVTWAACNSGITTPLLEMRCMAVKGNDIYAGSDGHGIFKSTNDGSTWTTVNSGLPGSFYSVSGLAVDGDTILAGTYGAGIYRSTNNGSSWSAVNNGVSPTDYIMGMGVNGSSVYAGTMNGVLYKTNNNSMWSSVAVGNFTATRFETFFSQSGAFYVGSWGATSTEQSYGLFKTTDNGTTWKQVGITQFPVSAIDVSGSNILAGTNDITGNNFRIPLFKTTEADSAWSFNLGGLSSVNITAIKSSGAVAYLFDYSGSGQAQVYRSTNNGLNWTSTGYSAIYEKFVRFVIAGSIVYAADNSDYSSSKVMVSSDNAQTWTSASTGIPSSTTGAYDLVLKGTTLFLATNSGVYKNTVGQNNWTAVSTGLTNTFVKALCVSGSDLYAGTQGGGVFKSTNDGGNWTSVSTGIPLFTNFTSFAATTGKIFAGTDNGIFMSTNSGASWTAMNTGLIDTSITYLAISSNYLWAGTDAHGIWRRNLTEFTTSVPPQPGTISGNTNVCPGSSNTYSIAPVSGASSYTWTLPSGWIGNSTSTSITAVAGSSGTISVTANNSYGASTPRTFAVTVNTVNTNVTQNGMTLNATASGANYVWINCANNQPIGVTSQSYTATQAGSYAVIVTQNGCSDTSSCYSVSTSCNISITGADLPNDGFTAIFYVDTLTNYSVGSAGINQTWNFSTMTQPYQKYAEYHLTSSTPYASTFSQSNLYTYGLGYYFGGLFGGSPIISNNTGYVFWKSDNTGLWTIGFRGQTGPFAGENIFVTQPELLVGAPASYGNTFNNTSRFVLPINNVPSDADTFYVRKTIKTITADACGSLTTPFNTYPEVLREKEYVITVDSVYLKIGTTTIYSMEYKRDTANNYMFISHSVRYPVCIVHATKNNVVKDAEFYAGPYTGIVESSAKFNDFFEVYPNPTDGIINIKFSSENVSKNISVYDAIGKLILQRNGNSDEIILDLSKFEKGIYMIKATENYKIAFEKIILK